MKGTIAAFTAILLAGCAAGPGTADRSSVMEGLQSSDPARRSAAVTEAADLGPAAVPAVGALLAEAGGPGRRAALRALENIGRRASRPGDDEARRVTSERLLDLVESGRPGTEAARDLLRLLGTVTADRAGVKRIAGLLGDRELSGAALFALVRIDHPSVDPLLIGRLARNRPEIAAALGARRSTAAVPALVIMARDPDDGVAGAGRHALALIGAARALSLLEREARERGARAERDLLLYLQERAHQTGSTADTEPWFPLLKSPTAATRCAAVVALAQKVPPQRVAELLPLLADDAKMVRQGAAAAIAARPEADLAARLAAAMPRQSPAVQAGILRTLLLCAPDQARDRAREAASARSPALRTAAIEVLADCEGPGLEPLLLAAAGAAEREVQAAAAHALVMHAMRRLDAGESPRALELLHRGLALPAASGDVSRGLGLLGRIGDRSSLEPVAAWAGNAAHAEEANAVRLAVARNSKDAEPDLARKLAGELLAASRSTSTRRAAADLLGDLGADTSSMARQDGFVTDWRIIGPLPKCTSESLGTHPFKDADPRALPLEGAGGGRVEWKARSTHDLYGLVDLTFMKPHRDCAAFALAEISWPRDESVTLALGSDDGIAVWVNGTRVHRNDVFRGVSIDEDRCKVGFLKGRNRILLQVNQGGGGWGFCLRIRDEQGRAFDLTDPARRAR